MTVDERERHIAAHLADLRASFAAIMREKIAEFEAMLADYGATSAEIAAAVDQNRIEALEAHEVHLLEIAAWMRRDGCTLH